MDGSLRGGYGYVGSRGGPDVDPHSASSEAERARWSRDLANFNSDLLSVNGFFLDKLSGKLPDKAAVTEKASSFFGVQGPWYTVGYRMAVIVEKRFGRQKLIETMPDPRRLLVLYNQAATEYNTSASVVTDHLPLWSAELLKEVGAN